MSRVREWGRKIVERIEWGCDECGKYLGERVVGDIPIHKCDHTVADGFGNAWDKCGPDCDMRVVRPGKVECSCE